MSTIRTFLAASALTLASAGAVPAQDSGSPSHEAHSVASSTENMLPEACRTIGAEAPPEQPMPEMPAMNGMDEAHQAFADGMMRMHPAMMAGMMAKDVDVAFICGMIPHHQGAIDMARVELQYGDDPWAKEMAQKVIDAQEKEIAEMTEWLEQHAN